MKLHLRIFFRSVNEYCLCIWKPSFQCIQPSMYEQLYRTWVMDVKRFQSQSRIVLKIAPQTNAKQYHCDKHFLGVRLLLKKICSYSMF